LHLLERTNITFQVQNSIVPKAFSLARIKVHGNLPRLQLNVSDAKYKTLMRLIDVTIPRFDDPEPAPLITVPTIIRSPAINRGTSSAYPFFDRSVEYNVESDSEDDDQDGSGVEQFFDAPTVTSGSQVVMLSEIYVALLRLIMTYTAA
jgi:vacuolar protein sorting-associated protein 13A/C